MKFFKSKKEVEPLIDDVKFVHYKFNNRPKPEDRNQILIICCFSEFGCETIGSMYCLPEILQANAGRYTIVVGWHGREYLYRHLVDEFWEIDESCMWLRDYAIAFHHTSRNLLALEHGLVKYGKVVSSKALGDLVVGVKCLSCGAFWGCQDKVPQCVACKSENLRQSLFSDVKNNKERAVRIPAPSEAKQEYVRQFLGPKPVGIFARGRKTYGRNLQPEFYVELIKVLERRGYSPIWLGEKQSTLPCPVDHIFDFSRSEMARDLELTLAITSQVKFTIQFWTASTRLAALMGTPYILFESPDQIWGSGQEGYRLNLASFGPKKLVISHFNNVFNNHAEALKLAEKAIEEVEVSNYETLLGLLESDQVVMSMMRDNKNRIGED